jgi:hypothetical protein
MASINFVVLISNHIRGFFIVKKEKYLKKQIKGIKVYERLCVCFQIVKSQVADYQANDFILKFNLLDLISYICIPKKLKNGKTL